MRKDKAFDCVSLKDDIQARLLSEWRGLSPAEVRQRVEKEPTDSDDPIARKWRRLVERGRPAKRD
jgi:hypothetical protein